MRIAMPTVGAAFLAGSMSISGLGQAKAAAEKAYPDPQRFESAIAAFEAADRKQPPPHGAVVCVGSSSMRGWHGAIKEDLAPLTVLPRGFGGSNMNDLLNYTERVVLAYEPRAIVVYEGDNDIAQGISPETVCETFRAFIAKVHTTLPECRVYFISIKPSISRWAIWPKMQEANALIAAECAKDKRLTFVDVAAGMLNAEGNPLKHIFKDDKLHMTRPGYEIWRDIVRPVVVEAERPFEPQPPAEADEHKGD